MMQMLTQKQTKKQSKLIKLNCDSTGLKFSMKCLNANQGFGAEGILADSPNSGSGSGCRIIFFRKPNFQAQTQAQAQVQVPNP